MAADDSPPSVGRSPSVQSPGRTSTTLRLSLTSKDATTEWLAVPAGATNAAIDVQADSAKTGTLWVADLEWSAEVGTDNERARAFSPPEQFTNAVPAIPRIALPSGAHIRLRTTTPDGDSDPAAPVPVVIT